MREMLVVEQHDLMRETVQELLIQLGWGSVAFVSGQDALKHLQSTEQRPDCILTAYLGVRDMRGSELIAAIKANAALVDIPCILMSGLELTEAQALQMGARAFLAKPFGLNELLNAINRVLS